MPCHKSMGNSKKLLGRGTCVLLLCTKYRDLLVPRGYNF
jgi:hypothetical protein